MDIVLKIALLMFFGTVSPFCAFALMVLLISKCKLLQQRLKYYTQLQLGADDVQEDKKTLKQVDEDIEKLCIAPLNGILHYFFPCFFFTSGLFTIYALDMAADQQISDYGSNSSLILFMVLSVITVRRIFYSSEEVVRRPSLLPRVSRLSEFAVNPLADSFINDKFFARSGNSSARESFDDDAVAQTQTPRCSLPAVSEMRRGSDVPSFRREANDERAQILRFFRGY